MKDFILAVENVPKPMLIAEAVLIVLIRLSSWLYLAI